VVKAESPECCLEYRDEGAGKEPAELDVDEGQESLSNVSLIIALMRLTVTFWQRFRDFPHPFLIHRCQLWTTPWFVRVSITTARAGV
jgi:hypothetical protein